MRKLLMFVGLLMLVAACSQRELPTAIPSTPSQAPMQNQTTPEQASISASPAGQVSNPAQPSVSPSAPALPSEAVVSQPVTTPPVATSGQTHQVRIAGFKFVPAELSISVGDTVLWTNEDSVGHSVISADRFLNSNLLGEGKSYSKVMSVPGTYNYICGPHPFMKGKIIVR